MTGPNIPNLQASKHIVGADWKCWGFDICSLVSRLYLQKGTEHPHFCLVRVSHMTLVLCWLQLLGLVLCSAHHINWLPFITTTTSSHLPILHYRRDITSLQPCQDLAGRRRITVTTTVHQSSQYLMMTLFHIKLTGVLNLSFIAE